MTSRIINFENPLRFVTGTVGLPGERTFFIQVEDSNRLISVSLEKSQVQALADRLVYMLREIKQNDSDVVISVLDKDDKPLNTPIE
ncbi:MAG: DUF3090 family protein, partial [Actinobacteria bacterium]|nr:DUF3090 family protein [Actinomycetota bacterium]